MPANRRSITVTNTYRQRTAALRDQTARSAAAAYRSTVNLDDLEATHAAWATATERSVRVSQQTAGRLSNGYLAAYLASETGAVGGAVAAPIATGAPSGKTVAEALAVALIAVRVALKGGDSFAQATSFAARRMQRDVGEMVMHSSRQTLTDAMAATPSVKGWRRVTSGGCGACLAATTDEVFAAAATIDVHPNCLCTAEPVITGIADRVRRPTGRDIFNGLTEQQQDELLGPDKARLIRSGDVPFDRLAGTSRMTAQPDALTERSLRDLQHP